MKREIEGLLPEVRHQIIANFYWKNVLRGNMYSFQHFKQMGCKKKPAIYHIMWLVDAGESVAQKEGQGRPSKLTEAREKKVTYFINGKIGPLRDHSLF